MSTERERVAGIVAKTRKELIDRGVIKNPQGNYLCSSCGKETREKYLGKCNACG
jgi:hypothetical protein